MPQDEAVELELVLLPRERMGPFLILGLEKDADREQIEANWAQRVIWARKNQSRVSLQDINWAREVLNDVERRIRADVTSLNTDTADRVLKELAERFGITGSSGFAWKPLDVDMPLADHAPDVAVPDVNEVRRSIEVPDLTREYPAVAEMLRQFAAEPIDPWSIST